MHVTVLYAGTAADTSQHDDFDLALSRRQEYGALLKHNATLAQSMQAWHVQKLCCTVLLTIMDGSIISSSSHRWLARIGRY